MMGGYIKRADALELTVYQSMMGLNMAQTKLREMPGEDVRPVVHGHWVWDDAKSIYRCSMCKSPKAREDMDRKTIKGQMFCHVCGARMDGKEVADAST